MDKFVTSYVQKLKILRENLIFSQGTDYKSVFLPNIFSFWTNNVTNFPKVSGIISSLGSSFWSCNLCPRKPLSSRRSNWQRSQYVELNPTCVNLLSWAAMGKLSWQITLVFTVSGIFNWISPLKLLNIQISINMTDLQGKSYQSRYILLNCRLFFLKKVLDRVGFADGNNFRK